MNAIVLLFLLGVLLLAGEIFLPGVIFGILGGVAMFGGCLISFQKFGTTGGTAATGLALALLVLTLYLELVWLPRTRFGKKLVVQSASDAQSQPPLARPEEVLGQTAEAVTTLAPSGYVTVAGRRYEAFCQTGLADKGSSLRVTGLDNFRLIVTKL